MNNILGWNVTRCVLVQVQFGKIKNKVAGFRRSGIPHTDTYSIHTRDPVKWDGVRRSLRLDSFLIDLRTVC